MTPLNGQDRFIECLPLSQGQNLSKRIFFATQAKSQVKESFTQKKNLRVGSSAYSDKTFVPCITNIPMTTTSGNFQGQETSLSPKNF